MLAPLALFTLLQASISGADGLTLANARLTHGVLGANRENADVRPGDSLILSFDIQGISIDAAGKASYATTVKVTDASGKAIFEQQPKKIQEFLPLGGATAPAFAQIDLGPDSPAGKYSMTVTVTDTGNGKTANYKQDFSVLPKAFDLVRLTVTGDADGLVPLGAQAVGQPYWVHASVVGYERPATGTKQPNVTIKLQVYEGLKPIMAMPFTGVVDKDVPMNAQSLPVRFFLPLNKAGNYTVELTATDELKKGPPARVTYPLKVVSIP